MKTTVTLGSGIYIVPGSKITQGCTALAILTEHIDP